MHLLPALIAFSAVILYPFLKALGLSLFEYTITTPEPVFVGLANYAATEARLIARKPSSQIEGLLGYANEAELIHRDNLVLIGTTGSVD